MAAPGRWGSQGWDPGCVGLCSSALPRVPPALPSTRPRLPVARSAHGATVYSDKLWIFAGYDGNAR